LRCPRQRCQHFALLDITQDPSLVNWQLTVSVHAFTLSSFRTALAIRHPSTCIAQFHHPSPASSFALHVFVDFNYLPARQLHRLTCLVLLTSTPLSLLEALHSIRRLLASRTKLAQPSSLSCGINAQAICRRLTLNHLKRQPVRLSQTRPRSDVLEPCPSGLPPYI
jgi:hypothetical protein